MEALSISPVSRPVCGSIRPPGSKSITNRALVCAALACGESILRGALRSEDTRVMIDALTQLGIDVAETEGGTVLRVAGCNGKIPKRDVDLFVANSGTTMRFLTAMVALGRGRYRLDGIERMRQRPIRDLLNALTELGVAIRAENDDGCPPVVVQSEGLSGGTTTMKGDVSSQFLSGLLMVAPLASENVRICLDGELVSRPYVEMTCAVMQAFGAASVEFGDRQFEIHKSQYSGRDYNIEPDASAASYFWAAAAITGGEVSVEGIDYASLQGDVRFCDCLRQMGCQVHESAATLTVKGHALRGIDVDMNEISDTVQTLAAVALFAEGATTIRNVAHIRHKETDRIGDLARELRKFGASVHEFDDGLTIVPARLSGARVATYNDHRMAMSLALVGLRVPGVQIENPECTQKTYPEFFADLARLSGAENPMRQ
ncbi:MAG: 3-phosphoshikimate 1-carboxyvinyltransferase [Planctomycetales bacterium]|nr:3-phosphoshikimate 1-carboxyvinyltransferase [Planctomycetales bacterium]